MKYNYHQLVNSNYNTCYLGTSLLHYYHHFRVDPAQEGIDSFFVTIDGYFMTPTAIQSLTKRLAQSSGVTRLHPHLLRHTYATMFLLNGGDIFLLKQNLGHSTLSMVEQYLHVASSIAAVRSQGFSPLDRLNVKNGRRYRHSFKREGLTGDVYPHAGVNRSSKGQTRTISRGRPPSQVPEPELALGVGVSVGPHARLSKVSPKAKRSTTLAHDS